MTNAPGRRRGRSVLVALAVLAVPGCATGGPDNDDGREEGTGVSLVLILPAEAEGPAWVREWDAEAQPRWVAVRGPGGERVFLREQCAIPDCRGDGGVCGMALPTVRRLDPGDSIRIEWDGRDSRTLPEELCEIREPVAPGEYRVEFCWTRREPDPPSDPVDGPQLTELACRTRSAEIPAVRRVAWVIG